MAKWTAGQSGNAKGRPRGRSPQTQLRESIAQAVPGIIETMVQAALGGDVQAARLLIERCIPPVKAQELPQAIALSDGTLSQQARAVVSAVAAGELAVGAGSQLLTGLGTLAKIVETDELAARITALEQNNETKR